MDIRYLHIFRKNTNAIIHWLSIVLLIMSGILVPGLWLKLAQQPPTSSSLPSQQPSSSASSSTSATLTPTPTPTLTPTSTLSPTPTTRELGAQPLEELAQTIMVPVYLQQEERIETVPLEAYVRGVLAAEMPALFEIEALKAQAIAARTYIVKRAMQRNFADMPAAAGAAWVTDTVEHQAYLTKQQMLEQWGEASFAAHFEKLTRAVLETAGIVLTYKGELIDAAYFSTSNGFTENAEEVWSNEVPYLRSVPSPWDAALSPRYKQVTSMSVSEFYQRLQLNGNGEGGNAGVKLPILSILEHTSGQRVKMLRVGDKRFSGKEIREMLELPSSDFQFMLTPQRIEFTTYGYGHGVGLSQYGAQGMALAGKSAEQILHYFYQDVNIESLPWTHESLADLVKKSQ